MLNSPRLGPDGSKILIEKGDTTVATEFTKEADISTVTLIVQCPILSKLIP